jgi:hypothetical protein
MTEERAVAVFGHVFFHIGISRATISG